MDCVVLEPCVVSVGVAVVSAFVVLPAPVVAVPSPPAPPAPPAPPSSEEVDVVVAAPVFIPEA